MQYAVGTQCAVGIGAKRSTGTVDLANMGGGGPLSLVQKGQTLMQWVHAVCSRYAVHSRCKCKKVNSAQWT